MTPAASDDDGDQRAQSDSGGEEQPQSPLAPPNGAPPDGSEDGYWESGDEYEEGWLSGDDEGVAFVRTAQAAFAACSCVANQLGR